MKITAIYYLIINNKDNKAQRNGTNQRCIKERLLLIQIPNRVLS